MSMAEMPCLWVVVSWAANGNVHTWGLYTDPRVAHKHKMKLIEVTAFDKGVSYRVCKVLNPMPLLNVVARTMEVNTYELAETPVSLRLTDSAESDTKFPADALPGL